MKNILVINGGQVLAHSGAKYNTTITEVTLDFFNNKEGFEVKSTQIAAGYDCAVEVDKYVWADVIIYHTPIWWFQLPYDFKKYIDLVFTEGYGSLYRSDGRKSENPAVNYGTGGLLQGKKYLLTTSWNAPKEAFTLPGEFFGQKSVDEGPLYGFHKMNEFIGMSALPSFHFHDVEKNNKMEADINAWIAHLENVIA
ncbi:NAD(P)H-dependent oxidoreductase [Sphingobacterium rhinopitheci]|uniref:NAD(P)H-dependent oxidoreductase n=1 Tax=Sphingobacterium rhinopitheci TaxID=2781960 RepID=UPI001F517E5A|nr:NAD(P)H-dependent oxidoreductase [Sphingobacterium rhinopitheci]MCI0921368.1 NAD(P)H-dependent oxidoreductase [Sphingobacterium rhinopitheci]